MREIITHLIAFLVGTATGAAGKYFADKFTDKRRRVETHKEEDARFAKMVTAMPDLLEEMRNDVIVPEHSAWREFFVIPKGSLLSGTPNSFFYEDDEKNAFLSKTRTLEEHGYVVDITPGNAPHFRMREEFVEKLRNMEEGNERMD